MPIFEYQCSACGHEFECLVLPTLSPPECPSCPSQDLQKLVSLCAVKSETTRQQALRDARKREKKRGREMAHEEHKAYHKHRH